MKLLKQLYKIYSPSNKEAKMIAFLTDYIKKYDDVKCEVDKSGNMYITRGESETYPCLAAHLDQVQHNHSKDFIAIESDGIIMGYSPSKKRMEGLGADDKNGIWVALKCLNIFKNIKVVFFVGEEIGCVGSSNCNMDFFSDVRFVVQSDRKGSSDMITTISGTDLCSEDFLSAIDYEKFGYHQEHGFMTDVLELTEQGIGVSCINVSCGYYDPHTDNEFTVKNDLINCFRFVAYIIETATKIYPHSWTQSSYSGISDNYFGWNYNDDKEEYHQEELNELYDIIFQTIDVTCGTPIEQQIEDIWEDYKDEFLTVTKNDFSELADIIKEEYNGTNN